MTPKHLPYQIDVSSNRFHYYENYWKKCGLKLLQKHFPYPTAKSVLDFGSGRGEAMEICAKAGYEVAGTDTDEECIKLSSKFGKATLLDTDNPVGQFGRKSYDIVVCYHVLEHCPSPVETITALSDIARKAVVIAVPNLQTLTRLFRREVHAESVNEGHLQ